MKHLFSLSMLLLTLLLPATATAHDFEVDGIYYNINDNEVSVIGSSISGNLIIPSSVTHNGTTYSVTYIDEAAFSGRSDLTSVTIPNSVTSVGNWAFSGCSGLTSVTIGNSVEHIGMYAFHYCTSLTSIDIPNSVTTIGNEAFYKCTSLTNIDIPNSVTSIGGMAFSGTAWYNNQPDGLVYAGLVAYKYKGTMPSGTSITLRDGTLGIAGDAFSRCNGLTSIDIPNSVTSIGYEAFLFCESLISVTIPNSVTSIGNRAFGDCSKLTSVTVANGNTTYDSRNNCNAIIETASNTLIAGCKNTIYPNSVTSIGSYAFEGCSGLINITIPNSVTSIGSYAFRSCSGLTSIDIPNSVTSIGSNAFDCTPWYNIQPDGLVYAGLVAYKYKGTMPNGTSITLCDGTLGIAGEAFLGCTGLTNITIPNSVTLIGNNAFSDCTGLTSIDIPNSVTSIGDWAFTWCSGLTSITIGNSVTSIGESAFYYCTGLTSITIPNSVTSIGYLAFAGCSGLTEINNLALVPPTISSRTFDDCYGATLYVPKQVVNAYKAAKYWKNFTNIVGIILPGYSLELNGIYYRVTDANEVSVIANEEVNAYYTGDVVIPESVTYAGQTFAVMGIENNAFDGCFELTSVVIPNSVTDIGEQAFQGCTGLTSVTIGSGVTTIGAKAFNYCNALATVKCIGTVPPVMANTDCFSTAAYNRATLIVPRNYEATYAAADYWYKFAHIDGWGSSGRGDIDGDGRVSISDVTALIDAILSGDYEGVYFESADLNINGRLDIGDVTTLIDMLLNDN